MMLLVNSDLLSNVGKDGYQYISPNSRQEEGCGPDGGGHDSEWSACEEEEAIMYTE